MAPKRSSGQTTPPTESRILHMNNTTSPATSSNDNDIYVESLKSMREWSNDTTTTTITATIRQTERSSGGPETPSNAYHNDHQYYYGVDEIPLTLLIGNFLSEHFLGLCGFILAYMWMCYIWTPPGERLASPEEEVVIVLVDTCIQLARAYIVILGVISPIYAIMFFLTWMFSPRVDNIQTRQRQEHLRRLQNSLSTSPILIEIPRYRAASIFILVGTYLFHSFYLDFFSRPLSWTGVVALWLLCFAGSASTLYMISFIAWMSKDFPMIE
ncbi:MAG: hypothetical protein J3R72DRAFT_75321 [Linnemannia gamsii]|nr:MAG: hypothetical protein J3R72DRAFT_75321 [Linnemannia gamsii]